MRNPKTGQRLKANLDSLSLTNLFQGTALGINNHSQVVGVISVNSVLWEHGMTTQLPSLPQDSVNVARAINDSGQIVGSSQRIGSSRAVLWQDGNIFDLNALLATPGWLLDNATDINDAGYIVGTGTNPNGEGTSFLLIPGASSPVPEPATWLLLATGCVGLVGYGWRRKKHAA